MEQISFETLSNIQVNTTRKDISCMYSAPLDKTYIIQIGPSQFKVNQLTYLQVESIVYPKIVVTNEEIESRIEKELNNDQLSTNEAPTKSNRNSKRQR